MEKDKKTVIVGVTSVSATEALRMAQNGSTAVIVSPTLKQDMSDLKLRLSQEEDVKVIVMDSVPDLIETEYEVDYKEMRKLNSQPWNKKQRRQRF